MQYKLEIHYKQMLFKLETYYKWNATSLKHITNKMQHKLEMDWKQNSKQIWNKI
jgi:hypothetical protein